MSSLSTEDVTAKGAATVMEGLQGTVPGVNITKNSSRAGGDFDIEIRGNHLQTLTLNLFMLLTE